MSPEIPEELLKDSPPWALVAYLVFMLLSRALDRPNKWHPGKDERASIGRPHDPSDDSETDTSLLDVAAPTMRTHGPKRRRQKTGQNPEDRGGCCSPPHALDGNFCPTCGTRLGTRSGKYGF